MAKFLTIIPERCTGCMQCELACAWVQSGSFQPSRSLIRVQLFDDLASYAPYTCFQCTEAWCVNACPVGAIGVDQPSGARVVIEKACIGCALCVVACPHGTIYCLPDTGKAGKCDLCGGEPACAAACPTRAIVFSAETSPGEWMAGWAAAVVAAQSEVEAGVGGVGEEGVAGR